MLSILIPAYNFDTSALIEELQRQSKSINEEVEIIIFDDHSYKYIQENENTAKKYKLTYRYLNKNIGRSKIRNLLAKHANFPFLLFLDGDVYPFSNLFLTHYMAYISENTHVIYGGRKHLYSKENKNKLRWKYGYYKEDKKVEKRQKDPFVSIITNNLLVRKDIFDKIKFDETLNTYGCEDTLFGFELRRKDMTIKHIDNPVIHKDIDNNAVFLSKTKQGLKNLVYLENTDRLPNNFRPVQRVYLTLNYLKLSLLFNWLLIRFQNQIEKLLLGEKVNLFVFDIYRMLYYCHLKQKSKTDD